MKTLQELQDTLNKNVTRIMVFNTKGGVGKTGISLNLSLTFGYAVITNDEYTIINEVLDDGGYVILEKDDPIPEYPQNAPIILDFGGFLDGRAIEALEQSQCVIIPVSTYAINLQTALDFIEEIKGYNKNIIVVINGTKAGEFQAFKNQIQKYHQVPIFEIKQSKAMSRIVKDKKSIHTLTKENKLHRRHFHKVAEQFLALANQIITYNS